uniref:VWFA domain-containing protein n=1 Tax=Panagrolaimus superbus TaxID=310955 RepID=A0A914Y0Z8_9BILA
MVFISDTSDHALRNAMRFMPIFKNFNLQLTFVLLGSNVDSTKLTSFTTNFIYWPDLTQPQPANWGNLYYTAYGCNGVVTQQPPSTVSTVAPSTVQSSTLPTTTNTSPVSASSTTSNIATTVQSTTTIMPTATSNLPSSTSASSSFTSTTPVPYLPCQSWISFSYDDSVVLNNTDYETQMNFISSAITNINYPNRLRVNGVYTNVASFNSHQKIAQMQTEIISVQQTEISYSLLQEFGNLLTDVEAIGNNQNWTIGSLIFISDTSDSALSNANIFFHQLPPSVKITFVLLGPTTDSTKLTQFSTNFIYWSDLTKPKPDNWDTLSYAAFGCQ